MSASQCISKIFTLLIKTGTRFIYKFVFTKNKRSGLQIKTAFCFTGVL